MSYKKDKIAVFFDGDFQGNYDLIVGPVCDVCSYPIGEDGTCIRPETHSEYVAKSYTIGLYYSVGKFLASGQSDFLSMHIYKGKNLAKYQKPLGLAIAELVGNRDRELSKFDLLVPVPQHADKIRRDKETGKSFNQAMELAKSIASVLSIPVGESALTKTRTQSMQGNVDQRKKAVDGLYKCEASLVRNKRVLLVDDVSTSGSTQAACAEEMMKSGATEVRAYVCGITYLE